MARATSLVCSPVWWNSRLATERAGLRIGSRFIRQTMLTSPFVQGKRREDLLPLVVELGPVDRDEAHVVGPGVEAEAPEPTRRPAPGVALAGDCRCRITVGWSSSLRHLSPPILDSQIG